MNSQTDPTSWTKNYWWLYLKRKVTNNLNYAYCFLTV